MAFTIVAHAGWDELLVAAVAVGIVLILRTRAERRRTHREEAADEAPSEEARR